MVRSHVGRRVEQQQETRQRLLHAGRRLFADVGFAATSLEAVSEAAGCSKTAVYKHFPNKDELFLTLMEQEALRQLDQVRAAAAHEPGAVLDAFVGWDAKSEGARGLNAAATEFMARAAARPELHQRIVALHMELDARSAALLEELCRARGKQPPMELHLLVLIVWSLASGLVLRAQVDTSLDAPATFALALDALLAGGRPRSET